jgi:hypothetical protein
MIKPNKAADEPARYEIRVKGCLNGHHWSEWFGGMTVTATEDGETVICGPVADQAALNGLLARLRDLALPLLSVNRKQGDVS